MRKETETALTRLTTGIYVLTVAHQGHAHGMSSSWVTQVSGEPPLIMAAVDVSHRTHAALSSSGHFVLNVVGRASRHLEDYFYSPAASVEDNLTTHRHRPSATGDPVLEEALAWLSCRVVATHRAGDHTLFVAQIVEAGVLARDDEPLSSSDLSYVYVGKVVPRR